MGKAMKKKMSALVLALLLALGSWWMGFGQADAASATVQFSADKEEVREGDEFHVVCVVSSVEAFNDVQMDVLYDAALFRFVGGGKKISGGNGVLHIASTGNDDSVKRRTFSLKFRALQKGTGNFDLDDAVYITDEEGEKYSISANLLTMSVSGAEESPDSVPEAPEGSVPPSPAPTDGAGTQSRNNKLRVLSFDALSMEPEFDPEVLEYTVSVDCRTEVLYFYFLPASSKARVRIRDNEELVPGDNQVRVVVTAESGDKRTYRINVKKESDSETSIREQKEKGTSDVTFAVYEKNGQIFIQNQYQFEVVDVKDEDVIPSGYVKTSVDLDGKSVPAYTMENDLDNNYLLMYLKGTGKEEPTLYQYDREEKTLQRYTGTMTQKVNQGGNVANDVKLASNMWLYVVLVVLMVMVIALLIVILNMALKKRVGRGRRELDDTDF